MTILLLLLLQLPVMFTIAMAQERVSRDRLAKLIMATAQVQGRMAMHIITIFQPGATGL